jgi:hypothetical protein
MVIPVPALPLLFQIAVADSVPKWDVTPSCRAAAAVAQAMQTQDRLKTCVESEHRTRDKLANEWSTFPAQDRIRCINAIKGSRRPTPNSLLALRETEIRERLAKRRADDVVVVAERARRRNVQSRLQAWP